MGIIKRQSLKNFIVNDFSVVIGALSTFLIYPLEWDLYGKIQFWMSNALLLSALLGFGSYSLVAKYYPYFKVNKIKGFLNFILLISVSTSLFFGSLILLFKNSFLRFLDRFSLDTKLLNEAPTLIFTVSLCMVLLAVFRIHSSNFRRIVVPDIITVLSLKLILPIIVLLFYFNYITELGVKNLLVLYHIIAAILLFLYLHYLSPYNFSKAFLKEIPLNKYKEMLKYMFFSAFNHLGNVIAYKVDLIMIGFILIEPKLIAYYSVYIFITIALDIPSKTIIQITNPIISNLYEIKDYKKLDEVYKKSSINLLVIGTLVFCLIWINLETLFSFMNNGEELILFKYIFLFLGIAKLIDMATSVNFSVIAYSPFYKYNSLFLVILAIINIYLNFILLNKYGILGTAIATCISMFIYNSLKTGIVFYKLKSHPFRLSMLFFVPFILLSLFIEYADFVIFNNIIDALIISTLFTILYILVMYVFKVSDQYVEMVNKTLKRVI